MRIIFSLLLLFSGGVFAQRMVDYNALTWWSNVNKYAFSDSWHAISEIHIRRADWILNWQQFVFRPSIHKTLTGNLVVGFGSSFVRQFPYGKQPVAMEFTELNLFEQIIIKGVIKTWRFSNRFRLENRRIPNIVYDAEDNLQISNYSLKERLRYRFAVKRELFSGATHKWYLLLFDEVFISLNSKTFLPSALQQNRLYAGFATVRKKTTLELGYLHQLIKKSDGVHIEVNPTVQIAVKYNFDFRKRED